MSVEGLARAIKCFTHLTERSSFIHPEVFASPALPGETLFRKCSLKRTIGERKNGAQYYRLLELPLPASPKGRVQWRLFFLSFKSSSRQNHVWFLGGGVSGFVHISNITWTNTDTIQLLSQIIKRNTKMCYVKA
jgi:hypothetical protein